MAQTIKLKRSATQGASPTTSQLELGEVAINTYDGKMYIKKNVGGTESIVEVGTGSGSGGGLASSFTLYEYTATASQTTFSGSDSNSNTLAYDTGTPPKILVYLNGVLLDHTTDYTATTGTSVVLTTGAAAGDLVQVAAYKSTVSTTLDIDLTDNQKLLLGTDDDLEIFHDGTRSIINDAGTGDLQFQVGGSAIFDVTTDGIVMEGFPESSYEIKGDLDGGIRFTVQAGEALSKGDVVYISGAAGDNTIVSKAQANSASTMPAFGLMLSDVANGASGQVVTFGNLYGSGGAALDTSAFTVGDTLYVSATTAGAFTKTAPTGESNLLQNIGKVVRSASSNGVIKVGGAGRTNAVPNLDDGDIFLGNSSNQAVSASLNTKIEEYLDSGVSTPTFAGITTTADVSFGDNDKAIFGAGSDLQIYHNGSHSFISEAGTGDLYIGASSNIALMNAAFSENKLLATTDGALKLYYDGSQKLATTSAGVDVTGTVTSDGLAVDGTANVKSSGGKSTISIGDTAASTYAQLLLYGGATKYNWMAAAQYNANNGFEITPSTATEGVTFSNPALRIDFNRDISFFEDTGTTAKFFWDASTEHLGIGTSSPDARLHVRDATQTAVTLLKLESGWNNPSGNKSIEWTDSTNTLGRISVDYTAPKAKMRFGSLYNSGYQTSDIMTLTADGNVGIGTISPDAPLAIHNSDLTTTTFNGTGGIRVHRPNAFGQYGWFEYGYNSDTTFIGSKYSGGTAASYGQIWFAQDSNGGSRQYPLVINGSGNVGIGTTFPYNKLHVNGTGRINSLMVGDASASNTPAVALHIKSSATNARLRIEDSDSSNDYWDFYVNQGDGLHFQEEGANRVTFKTGGNVGIGTDIPARKLEVNTGSEGYVARFKGSTSAVDIFAGNTGSFTGGLITTPTNIPLGFSTNTGAGSLIIATSGNVGIGTINPLNPLHIKQSGGSHLLALETSYAQDRSGRGQISWRDSGNITGGIWTEYDGTTVSMRFGNLYNSGYNSNTSMIIRGNGNVGIGTISPEAKLHTVGHSRLDGAMLQKSNLSITSANISTDNEYISHNGPILTNGSTGNINQYGYFRGYQAVYGSDGTNGFNPYAQGAYSKPVFEFISNNRGSISLPTDAAIRDGYLYQFVLGNNGSGSNNGVELTSSNTTVLWGITSSNDAYFANNVCIGNTAAGAKLDIRQDSGFAVRIENSSGHYFRVAAGGAIDVGGSAFVDANRNLTNIGTISSGNITTTGYLAGPATFTIDPAAVGDNTGTVVIAGNLQVDGTTTTINSTTLTVDDKNITLASGSSNAAAANGAGITVDCGSDTDATFTYDGTNDEWDFNKNINVTGAVVSSANGAITTASGTTARFSVNETGGAITAMDARGSTGNIGTRSNHTLGFLVNDVQKATLTANGDFTVTNDLKLTTTNPRIDYDNNGSGALRFYSMSAAQERMRITSGGNVGIGTTSPNDGKLQVYGNSSSDWAGYFYNQNANGIGLHVETNSYGTEQLLRLSSLTGSGGSNTVRMVVRADGNVGIGDSTPTFKLDVAGTGRYTADLYAENDVYIGGKLRHNGDTDNYIGFGTDIQSFVTGNSTRAQFSNTLVRFNQEGLNQDFQVFGQNDDNLFYADASTDRIGIGTTTPGAKLQVEDLGIDTTTTSTSATTQVAIDTMAAATFRSAKYTIQVTNSTDSTYHITEILLIHDGTTPGITEYGTVFTGSAAEATFDADISSGNVRLLATPASTDSMTFKVVRHCITV
jgi:lipopolysaccharide export system protein LptA